MSILTGTASDDSGATTNGIIGTTTSGPTRRQKNPLSFLSSYTYQLSLYMITPTAYDAFLDSGRKTINSIPGALLIAQSGGANVADRAPGFEFDYGIDNLSFEHLVNPKADSSSAFNTNIQFTITEPYGFSFITNLRQASASISELDPTRGPVIGSEDNASRQFFVLGIRFFGYLADGSLATGKENFNGEALDINASGNGALFETYYDMFIKSIKFKINGSTTTYTVEANAAAPYGGFGTKKGYLNTAVNATGSTVDDILTGEHGLFTIMNAKQAEMAKNGQIQRAVTYSVEYQGTASSIQYAKMAVANDDDKSKQGPAGADTSTQATAKTEVTAIPNPNVRTVSFAPAPIVSCLDLAIKSSDYIDQALKVNYQSSADGENTPIKKPSEIHVAWYNVSTRLSNPTWDSIIGDWSYDITYVIQPYDTPAINSVFVNAGVPYYGPHKRYDYWYTGQNTEILNYEQTLDNSYYVAYLVNDDQSSASSTGVPLAPGQPSAQSAINTLGPGSEPKSNYLTSLFDQASRAQAKIDILGDPDFLIQESSSLDQFYDRFYGVDGFTINPNGGQVFIEIDFKEAIDYNIDAASSNNKGTGQPGTLSINDSILFWKYSDKINSAGPGGTPLVKGVSYMVNIVESRFVNGTFKQTLHGVINPLDDSSDGTTATTDSSRPDTTVSTSDIAGLTSSPVIGFQPVPAPVLNDTIPNIVVTSTTDEATT